MILHVLQGVMCTAVLGHFVACTVRVSTPTLVLAGKQVTVVVGAHSWSSAGLVSVTSLKLSVLPAL